MLIEMDAGRLMEPDAYLVFLHVRCCNLSIYLLVAGQAPFFFLHVELHPNCGPIHIQIDTPQATTSFHACPLRFVRNSTSVFARANLPSHP